MIEKSLMIVLFFYSSGFMILGAQYVLGDVYHVTLEYNDVNLQSAILETIDTDAINTVTTNIADATDSENSTLDAITNAFQLGYNVGKELLLLLTGTYIFNMMYLFGIPIIVIAAFVGLYMFCVGRTLIAYIRGV